MVGSFPKALAALGRLLRAARAGDFFGVSRTGLAAVGFSDRMPTRESPIDPSSYGMYFKS